MLRRTIALELAYRPGGVLAAKLQLKHIATATTEGYAKPQPDGIHDDLENGGGISGPAARRAIRAAATAPRFAGTQLTLASARKLLKNEDAMIYDNPHALVICHYKREKALCHRDGTRDTPSLDHCVPGCGNIARTDAQAAQLRERADALETQAQHVPQPVGDRLRAAAAKLREQAGKHDRTRITPGRAEG